MSQTTETLFSVNNLDIFKRPGAVLEKRSSDYHAGVWIDLANGWRVSVQWGKGNYGDNYHRPPSDTDPPHDSKLAEIAVMRPPKEQGGERPMVEWGFGDWAETVLAYCPMDRAQRIIDLTDRGELIQMWQPPAIPRAIDGWADDENQTPPAKALQPREEA